MDRDRGCVVMDRGYGPSDTAMEEAGVDTQSGHNRSCDRMLCIGPIINGKFIGENSQRQTAHDRSTHQAFTGLTFTIC